MLSGIVKHLDENSFQSDRQSSYQKEVITDICERINDLLKAFNRVDRNILLHALEKISFRDEAANKFNS